MYVTQQKNRDTHLCHCCSYMIYRSGPEVVDAPLALRGLLPQRLSREGFDDASCHLSNPFM
jgi:hypothetical protein